MTGTLAGLLAQAARTAPDAPCLIEADGRITSFAALDDLARRYAGALATLGVGQGDRVALWLPNTPEHYALAFAVWRLGAVVVGVNTRFRAKEVEDIVGRSGAKILAFQPGFKRIAFEAILGEVDPHALERLETVLVLDHAGTPVPDRVLGLPAVRVSRLAEARPLAEDNGAPALPAQIFTTSGTTSKPKFVLHAQRSICGHAPRAAEAWGVTAEDGRVLQAAPLCGVVGLVVATLAIAARRPQIIQPLFDPAEAGELIRRHRVTHMINTDEAWERMLRLREEPVPFPSLRACPSFGANPPLESFLRLVEERGLPIVNAYGMSECLALFSLTRADEPLARRAVGGGWPLTPQSGVRIRDVESGELLGPGKPGELEVSGPTLMLEYADNPDATDAVFTADGWLRTGDLAQLDDEPGRFTYLARMGDVLRLAGFLVSPAEIEAELERDPAVRQAQVVGVRTEQGAKAFAFVLAREGQVPDERRLIDACRARLANYKVPIRVVTLAAFPVTESPNAVKIQRHKLRTMAEETLAGGAANAAQ